MGNIFKKIEDAFMAAAFAEAGEYEFAQHLLDAGKNSHKKVLLSTDCPIITVKILSHALNLCKRLGGSLEVYQFISTAEASDTSPGAEKNGVKRLQVLQKKLSGLGITYEYAIKDTSLRDELAVISVNRRDIMAVIVPLCEGIQKHKEDFQEAVGAMFSCPVIFFEAIS